MPCTTQLVVIDIMIWVLLVCEGLFRTTHQILLYDDSLLASFSPKGSICNCMSDWVWQHEGQLHQIVILGCCGPTWHSVPICYYIVQWDDDNPLVREYGLWAVRNLCEGNEDIQSSISSLRACSTVDSPDLQARGLQIELDGTTGKPKLVSQPPRS